MRIADELGRPGLPDQGACTDNRYAVGRISARSLPWTGGVHVDMQNMY
jgi:hypothetical protein